MMTDIDIQLSCADSAFPKLWHEMALAVIRDLDFSAVDVCVFAGYEHTPPERVLTDPVGAADSVGSRLERFGLKAVDAFAILGALTFEDLAVNHPDGAIREESMRYFDAFLAFAARLGTPGLTVLPGTTFAGIDEDDSLELAAAELRRRAARAHEAGLQLSVEPHFGSIVQTPARTLELMQLAPEVSLTLDYSHFVYQDIHPADVDPLLPYARHIHVRPAAPNVIQARASEGIIDYRGIADRLIDRGYTGWFALEYQWEEAWEPGAMDFTRVDCISETVAMRDVLRGTARDV